MTIKEIAKKISENDNFQALLDEIVHDRFSNQASDLNNQGPEAQLEWLEKQGEDSKDIFSSLKSS